MKYFLLLVFCFFCLACKNKDDRFSKESSGILYNLKDYSYFDYQQIKDPDFPALPLKPPFPELEFELIDPSITPYPIIDLLKPPISEIEKVDCDRRDEVLAQLGRLSFNNQAPENGFVLDGYHCLGSAGENCSLANISSVGWYLSSEVHFRVIPLHILCLTNLQFISIVDFGLGALAMNEFISEPVLEHFKTIGLKGLRLNDNEFSAIPSSIFELTDLQILSLSGNENISNIPSFKKLSKLKQLYLSGLNLTDFGDLPSSDLNLEVLYVNQNKKLFNFRYQDRQLKTQILSMVNSNLMSFSEILAQTQVAVMDFSDNIHITTVPNISFGNNNSLENLKLNSLHTFDANLLDWAKKLEKLDFSGSKISQITGDFSNCNVLSEINLARNQIQHVPTSLGRCAKLLILDDNQITEVNELLAFYNNNGNDNLDAELSLKNNKIRCFDFNTPTLSSIWVSVDLQNNHNIKYHHLQWMPLKTLKTMKIILSSNQFSPTDRQQMQNDFGTQITFK